jgi:hypothetical protein
MFSVVLNIIIAIIQYNIIFISLLKACSNSRNRSNGSPTVVLKYITYIKSALLAVKVNNYKVLLLYHN